MLKFAGYVILSLTFYVENMMLFGSNVLCSHGDCFG
jgi:hypothetical protein